MAGIFKAYDVRGIYPREINEEMARSIGLAFRHVLDDEDRSTGNAIVVSRDMRPHSPPLQEALIEGLLASGLDVIDIGLATTPMNYFAVGHLRAAGGIQVTASHNPAEYNGLKFSRSSAKPVSGETGIAVMERAIQDGDLDAAPLPGTRTSTDVTAAYREHVLSFLASLDAGTEPHTLHVVVDAANGMSVIYRDLLEATGINLTPLNFELDGTFPNHEANPLKEENLRDLVAKVRELGADLGVSFDGDADRAAFIDETGEPVGSDLMTGLIAGELLSREPGKAALYDLRSSRAVPEYISEAGGVPVRERVGHSFMKATLRRREGIFGGELAGHYYFRDNFNADSAVLAVVEVINLMRRSGKPLSALVAPLRRYAKSPEINFVVEDKTGRMRELEEKFSDGRIDHLDGVTVEYDDWWFNVRPSNTEPYLRLVVEARTPEELARHRSELEAILGTPV
jgi:phosphomannomutase